MSKHYFGHYPDEQKGSALQIKYKANTTKGNAFFYFFTVFKSQINISPDPGNKTHIQQYLTESDTTGYIPALQIQGSSCLSGRKKDICKAHSNSADQPS